MDDQVSTGESRTRPIESVWMVYVFEWQFPGVLQYRKPVDGFARNISYTKEWSSYIHTNASDSVLQHVFHTHFPLSVMYHCATLLNLPETVSGQTAENEWSC